MASLALIAVGAVLGTALVWVGGSWLEGAANRLSAYYGLPAVVQGAIVAAVGSSFPELASVVIATWHYGEFAVGVAGIFGSAIFNVLVIPAIAALVLPKPLQATRELVHKEALFYLVSVASLFLAFALGMIYYPTGESQFQGQLTRPLAVGLLALYGLYVWLQYQSTQEHTPESRPSIALLRQWGLLLGGMALIVVGVEGLVYATTELGAYFDTPSFYWGVVVIAAGTSIPDAVISVKAARAERGSVGMANVFGSNIFDLLVAIPVGVLIAGQAIIEFDRAVPIIGFLIVATIATFALSRTDFEITNPEAYLLLGLYVGFVVWMLLESVSIVNVIP